jgi:transcriptional regulator of aromatic amino acid metabolism
MVVIHCGALTETLLESELFGHERGAFTGAQYRKKGKFEVADGGTAFLDEISDISLKTQTDLLRVLQEKENVRVGGTQNIKVLSARAATTRNWKRWSRTARSPGPVLPLNVFAIRCPRCASDGWTSRAVNHFLQKIPASITGGAARLPKRDLWMATPGRAPCANWKKPSRRDAILPRPEIPDTDFPFPKTDWVA